MIFECEVLSLNQSRENNTHFLTAIWLKRIALFAHAFFFHLRLWIVLDKMCILSELAHKLNQQFM